jgi:hypothetical protein
MNARQIFLRSSSLSLELPRHVILVVTALDLLAERRNDLTQLLHLRANSTSNCDPNAEGDGALHRIVAQPF